MAKNPFKWNKEAGAQARDARMNLEANGATQDRIADHSGLKQPTLSQIESGARRPSLGALANLYTTLKPGFDPEGQRFFLDILIEHSHRVDFASKLGLATFAQAKSRAQRLLNFGGAGSVDTWYVLRAVQQLATTPEEKAYAEMLMGNRFKDLGIWETESMFRSPAEEHYNAALSYLRELDSREAVEIRNKVLVNLASVHVELGRSDIAEALVERLFAHPKHLAPEVRAEAYFVRGKIFALRGAKRAALKDFEAARAGYTRVNRKNNADWIWMHDAVLRGDASVLEKLIERYKPAPASTGSDESEDPENYYWSQYYLAVLKGDLTIGQKILKQSNAAQFRHLIAKVKMFLSDPAVVATAKTVLVVLGFAAAALGIDGALSEVFAKSCN